jgi:hypothetical protein
VTSAMSRATVHNAEFPTWQTPGFIGETEDSSVQYEFTRECSQVFTTDSYEVSSLLEVTVTSEVK